jgi:hypothetical protein
MDKKLIEESRFESYFVGVRFGPAGIVKGSDK